MTLSSQIKALRSNMGISQKELANLLKVSQTSIAHYELGNRQPTIDTLIAMSTLFNVSIDQLVGRPPHTIVSTELKGSKAHVDYMIELLVNKNSQEFTNYLFMISNQVEMSHIIESLIAETQNKIGSMWEKDQINVADEHYITNVIRKSMHQLFSSIEPNVQKKRAISMTAHSEQHTLGIELVSEFLEKKGIKTLYLGGNVPTSSLIRLIDDYRPDYLFISITHQDHINSLIMLIESIHSHSPKLEVIIGGQACQNLKIDSLMSTKVTIVSKMHQLVEKLGLSQ